MTKPKELSAEELAQVRGGFDYVEPAAGGLGDALLSHIAALESKLEESNALVREMAEAMHEQGGGQKWRALALVIKAKLEAVESGITVFEDEFMAHIVLPGGQTVGDWMRPQIESAYSKGEMPKLLPME